MIKKHQKITKFKQKNVILMSEKISVILINKRFYWKYVEVVYPLKQGLKHCQSWDIIPLFTVVEVVYPLK